MSSKYANSVPSRECDAPPKDDKPKFCAVAGCMTHWNPKEEKHEPGLADVIFTLESGAVIARCAEHYMRHLYRAGKGTMSEVTGRDWQITLEAVKAHWAKLDAAEAAKAKSARVEP